RAVRELPRRPGERGRAGAPGVDPGTGRGLRRDDRPRSTGGRDAPSPLRRYRAAREHLVPPRRIASRARLHPAGERLLPPDPRRERSWKENLMRLHLPGLIALLSLALAPSALAGQTKLKVGVTLHPYYSWTANVVAGTDVEVRAILPGEVDAGNYQPRP